MDCEKCGYAMSDFDVDCPRCKRIAEQKKNNPQQEPEPPPAQTKSPSPFPFATGPASPPQTSPVASVDGPPDGIAQFRRLGYAAVIGLVLFGLLFISKYHIVQSSDGTTIIPKVHMTFAETMISVDEITTIPYVEARKKHPLAVRALQREGIIETEEEMESRTEREFDEKMKEAEAETQRRMEQAEREYDAKMEQERRRIEATMPSY